MTIIETGEAEAGRIAPGLRAGGSKIHRLSRALLGVSSCYRREVAEQFRLAGHRTSRSNEQIENRNWGRSDISAAPKDRRILMIATSTAPNEVGIGPDIVLAHWYEGSEWWVAADIYGESRPGVRLALNPTYWAELGDLPSDISLRPLKIEDFRG
jgi:hypothetical protein